MKLTYVISLKVLPCSTEKRAVLHGSSTTWFKRRAAAVLTSNLIQSI